MQKLNISFPFPLEILGVQKTKIVWMIKVSTYIILTEAKLKAGGQMWKKTTLPPSGFSVVYLKVNTVNHTLL